MTMYRKYNHIMLNHLVDTYQKSFRQEYSFLYGSIMGFIKDT